MMTRRSLSWQLILFITYVYIIAHFMMPTGVNSSVIDTPHNESNNITCGTCHKYSVWWQFSPLDSQPAPAEKTNALCLGCHGENGPEIQIVNHASNLMGAAHRDALGDWSRACINCHDPHLQGQLDWQGTVANSDLYLVEGRLAAGTLQVSGQGTDESPYSSTFGYTDLIVNAENWQNSTTPWTAKTSADRGLILTLLANDPASTFEIVNVDEGQAKITVSGKIRTSFDNNATTFGLIYGQLIRNKIKVGEGVADVQFFNNKGGFVDLENNQGICQVCHTQTLHFRNSGEVNIGTPIFDHSSQVSINCLSCHSHSSGLAFDGTDLAHDHRSAGETICSNCHAVANPAEIDALHNGCATCHSYDGSNPNISATDVANTISSGIAGTDVDCSNCHGDGHDTEGDHNNRVLTGLDPDCSTCHDLITDLVIDQSKVDGLHNDGDCALCHSYAGDKLDPDTVAAVIAEGKGLGGTAQNCQQCHTIEAQTFHHVRPEYAVGNCSFCHKASSASLHDHRSASETSCGGCHDVETAAEIDILHTACASCHAYYGTNPNIDLSDVTNTIAAGIAGTEINCLNCHGTESVIVNQHHRTSNYLEGNCEHCHADPRATWDAMLPGDLGGGSPRPTQLGCRECHVTYYNNNIRVQGLEYVSDNYSLPATKTIVHDLPGNMARGIGNFGTCLSCHDGLGDAPAVSIYHGKPPLSLQNKVNCLDQPYGPGRETFKYFAADFRHKISFETRNSEFLSLCYQDYNRHDPEEGPAGGYENSLMVPFGSFNGGPVPTETIAAPIFPALGNLPAGGYPGTQYDSTTTVMQVPVPYATIASAIKAAGDGDIIEVADGTYPEILTLSDKNITIRSINGAASTIIDVDGLESTVAAVSFTGGNTSTLEGFTIRNGSTANTGGGIEVYDSSPTIKDCIITNNLSTYKGGGINVMVDTGSSHLTVIGSTISNNLNTNKYGAGINLGLDSSATIIDTTFTNNNNIYSSGMGGGLNAFGNNTINIDKSVFAGNASNRGGAINFNSGSLTMTATIIKGNSAGNVGGGLYCGSGTTEIINSMITGNFATNSGGGLENLINTTTISNSTFAANNAATNGGINAADGSLVTVNNSIFWGNYAGQLNALIVTYSAIEGGDSGTGNIDQDPLFVDPRPYSEAPTSAGDYHLGTGSPCEGAAEPTLAPETDFEGDSRPAGSGDDMGADEYTTT